MFDILAGRARVGITVAALVVPSAGTAADTRPAPHRAGADRHVKAFASPDRAVWRKPDEVVSLLQLWPGNVVADLGAGSGLLEPLLARAVGTTGRVLAFDVAPHRVTDLERQVKKEGLGNVVVQKAAAHDPGLPDGSVDRLLVVDTWHRLRQRTEYAAAINRARRPGGFVVVVDFTAESPEGPPAHAHLSPATVIAELQAGGFSARTVAESLPLPIRRRSGQETQVASRGRPAPTVRQRALVDIIDTNAANARFTRGVNTSTVEALARALAPTDDPELRVAVSRRSRRDPHRRVRLRRPGRPRTGRPAGDLRRRRSSGTEPVRRR